jgi:hypothetical protein
MPLSTENPIVVFFSKLPPSTNSWTCRWFLTIIAASIAVAIVATILLPGTAPTIALLVADSVAFYVLGMRSSSTNDPNAC